ncbi:LysR family transcriptional regulator [Paludibacterium yongneupense]|uniref:LysR family transcriptional regulator n=1 Tax=Paludibacterium yongneupense TaxID=400061 RepID=UPI0003FF50E9|nr:LysR family transcriptional regulator [Paludibacterium yongneupense]
MSIPEEVTFKKLEVFLLFMKLGSLVRVSEALQQSTVSVHRALHSLEEGLRCPLFQRQGRSLVPLPAAVSLVDYAERALQACESGVLKAREVAGFNSLHLRVGALYSLTIHTVPQLFTGLTLRKPGIDIEVTMGSNPFLLRKLLNFELDAVLVAQGEGPAPAPDLQSVPLFDDLIYFAAPLGSPFQNERCIDLERLSAEKFVSLREEFATYADFNTAFERAGYRPDIVMRVGDIFSLINMVGANVGYGLLPGRVGANFSHRIQLIPLSERYRMQQHIVLTFLAARERDPNLLALAAECRMYHRHEGVAAN